MLVRIFKLLIVIVAFFWVAYIGWGMYKKHAPQGESGAAPTGSSLPQWLPKLPFLSKAASTTETKATEQKPSTPVLEEEILPQVRTLRIKAMDYKDLLPVMGQVKGETEIGLGFEVNGVIKTIRFREGQVVKKGDLIATLDSQDAELKQAYSKAKYNSAQAAYNSVKKQLEVHTKLYEAGAIIKSKMEQVELEVESAKFQLETARSEMELADNELRKTFLYAPKDGLMGPRKAEEGEFLSTQDKFGSLYDIANVFVEVGVVERDIQKVRIGQIAKIYVDAYPNKIFEGRVEYIFPVVERKSRTMTVKIKVINAQMELRPGMFCRADLNIIELPRALMVPSNAIINNNNVITLPIIPAKTIEQTEDEEQTGIPEIRRVTVGYMTSDHVQILEGANDGDLAVLEVQGEFREGRKVKIVGIDELSF